MEYKIIQIMSAPNNMSAVYMDQGEIIKNKIVCLALIQYEDGETEVILMDVTNGDGEVSKIGPNLKFIEFNNQ